MSTRDRGLAALVALLWGLNFLAVRIGLDHFPPFFLAALRYLLLAVPVILFVPRPKVPLRWLLAYGLGFGALQFGLLFLAIDVGMPTGLSSVVLQAAAPFTVLLGMLLLSERVSGKQIGGVVVAILGLVVIAVDRAQVAALLPLILTLLAALACALGMLAGRLAKPDSPLRFTLWMAVVPPIPLLALSAVMEGPSAGWIALGKSLSLEGLPGLAAMAYIVVLGTVVGSGIWTALLKRYPASIVAPFTMLTPVVGIGAAWIALNETPSALALLGSTVVIGGVLLGTPPRPADVRSPADSETAGKSS
ncbi:EamA family transporter [Kibdelosporangium philippinense]|uniref:EamA family transporter n=1 Tax=Kibdelosporangium philippinense TaxID=211113 RepID=A0ABS8ZMI0_9PSEU|nr:EamA family transporter [Kibdelosporangium philippinense]MCE7008170.1 EamA family transporter [Kibdelosporangium philippinense]